MTYTYKVPVNSNLLISNKKSTHIQNLNKELYVKITYNKPTQQNGIMYPFFLIEGEEIKVNIAALRIYTLLYTNSINDNKDDDLYKETELRSSSCEQTIKPTLPITTALDISFSNGYDHLGYIRSDININKDTNNVWGYCGRWGC